MNLPEKKRKKITQLLIRHYNIFNKCILEIDDSTKRKINHSKWDRISRSFYKEIENNEIIKNNQLLRISNSNITRWTNILYIPIDLTCTPLIY